MAPDLSLAECHGLPGWPLSEIPPVPHPAAGVWAGPSSRLPLAPFRFWSLLERFLPTHSICSLPFVTSFCLGLGTRRVCYGKVCRSWSLCLVSA
jgi:hypothetical protein